MADSILARLRGDAPPPQRSPPDIEIDLTRNKPLNIVLPPPMRPPPVIVPENTFQRDYQPQATMPPAPMFHQRIEPVPRVLRANIQTRPSSIATALDIFGNQGVDTLLAIIDNSDSTESNIHDSAMYATYLRRFLVMVTLLCSTASCILNATPICDTHSIESITCLNNLNMASAIVSSIGIVAIFITEKIQARNSAVRLRDLQSQFNNLSGEARNALYVSPPATAAEAQAFSSRISEQAADLMTRARALGIKPKPRPRRAYQENV